MEVFKAATGKLNVGVLFFASHEKLNIRNTLYVTS